MEIFTMNRSTQRGRRTFVAALGATLAGLALPSWATYRPDQFRIGYQKAASTLVLLKAKGVLEQRLGPLGGKGFVERVSRGPTTARRAQRRRNRLRLRRRSSPRIRASRRRELRLHGIRNPD